ncbi:hypothetical protein, partial [uncultured Succinatimonas sp.]|uniref:hypothetical protein n=1 Tax=uncultured Succinatimonas sp. TaxID=1262973 RepID=UPI0025FE5427
FKELFEQSVPLKWLHIIEILFLLSTTFFALRQRESSLSPKIPDFYAILLTLKLFKNFLFFSVPL